MIKKTTVLCKSILKRIAWLADKQGIGHKRGAASLSLNFQKQKEVKQQNKQKQKTRKNPQNMKRTKEKKTRKDSMFT